MIQNDDDDDGDKETIEYYKNDKRLYRTLLNRAKN